jgi:hypothetical protein
LNRIYYFLINIQIIIQLIFIHHFIRLFNFLILTDKAYRIFLHLSIPQIVPNLLFTITYHALLLHFIHSIIQLKNTTKIKVVELHFF